MADSVAKVAPPLSLVLARAHAADARRELEAAIRDRVPPDMVEGWRFVLRARLALLEEAARRLSGDEEVRS